MGGLLNIFYPFSSWLGRTCLIVVEETRLRGEFIRPINSTFIALIMKVNSPNSFSDFRRISLCNLCYKIIAKVIARRIRPILSRTLSAEQLVFLKGR
jgi:hypothetical protein